MDQNECGRRVPHLCLRPWRWPAAAWPWWRCPRRWWWTAPWVASPPQKPAETQTAPDPGRTGPRGPAWTILLLLKSEKMMVLLLICAIYLHLIDLICIRCTFCDRLLYVFIFTIVSEHFSSWIYTCFRLHVKQFCDHLSRVSLCKTAQNVLKRITNVRNQTQISCSVCVCVCVCVCVWSIQLFNRITVPNQTAAWPLTLQEKELTLIHSFTELTENITLLYIYSLTVL